jgi:catechol 2,3-dioxygenase-like lactoylglutathione lyase family enzyme
MTVTFSIVGLDHIVIRTANVDGMIRFYTEVLGCAVERRLEKFGLIQLRAGRALIDLVDADGEIGRKGGAAPGEEGHNMDHLCLRIDPFDEAAIRAHLAAHGIDVGPTERRYGAEGVGPSIYIRDPDGNTVELKGPADEP